jgi:hypothetical protein
VLLKNNKFLILKITLLLAASALKAVGDVIRTSGRGYDTTLTGLTPEQISNFFTPTISKPKPKYLYRLPMNTPANSFNSHDKNKQQKWNIYLN